MATRQGRHKGAGNKEPTPRVPRDVDQHAGAFSHPFRGREATCEHVQAMWGQQGPTRQLILPHAHVRKVMSEAPPPQDTLPKGLVGRGVWGE
eukprot:scaffold189_cov118-Isochrysis_galbana.AAC.14